MFPGFLSLKGSSRGTRNSPALTGNRGQRKVVSKPHGQWAQAGPAQRPEEEWWCLQGGLAGRREAGSADETEEGSERSWDGESPAAGWGQGHTHLKQRLQGTGHGEAQGWGRDGGRARAPPSQRDHTSESQFTDPVCPPGPPVPTFCQILLSPQQAG